MVFATLLIGCGGDLQVYNLGEDAADSAASAGDVASDRGSSLDAGNSVRDAAPDGAPPVDAGGPDLPPQLDMGPMTPVDPTTNTPQTGPSVEEQITSQCSTIAVKGLSTQLIDQMNCEVPGIMKSFAGAPDISYGAVVFPFLQGPATDAFTAVAANNAGTLPVSSALRTLPQQFLLYEWYRRGLCNANLAAAPGSSNHNGGLAVDIGDSSTWRSRLRSGGFVDNVSGEPWHFYFTGGGTRDVRNLSVLAFQKLYNRNFPENKIDEDGLYGPMTEGALKRAPAEGFTLGARCQAVSALVAYPNDVPLDVDWARLDDQFVEIRTLATAGVELLEYHLDGRLVGFSGEGDGNWFSAVLPIPFDDLSHTLEVRAFDGQGAERGYATGSVDGAQARDQLFVRPMGGDNYEIGVRHLPDNVHDVEYFIDGLPVERDARLAVSNRGAKRAAVQMRGRVQIDAVLLDRRDRVVELLERDFFAGR